MRLHIHLTLGLPGTAETTATVTGDVLTVDGVAYDLSAVPDGGAATLEGTHPFVGEVRRINGEIEAGLVWAFRGDTAEADQGGDVPLIAVASGAVPDPVNRREDLL